MWPGRDDENNVVLTEPSNRKTADKVRNTCQLEYVKSTNQASVNVKIVFGVMCNFNCDCCAAEVKMSGWDWHENG